jgi:hypothetical protein
VFQSSRHRLHFHIWRQTSRPRRLLAHHYKNLVEVAGAVDVDPLIRQCGHINDWRQYMPSAIRFYEKDIRHGHKVGFGEARLNYFVSVDLLTLETDSSSGQASNTFWYIKLLTSTQSNESFIKV